MLKKYSIGQNYVIETLIINCDSDKVNFKVVQQI